MLKKEQTNKWRTNQMAEKREKKLVKKRNSVQGNNSKRRTKQTKKWNEK